MKTTSIEKWTWWLIYVGLGMVGLGLAVQRRDESVGWPFIVLGGVAVALGVLLIFLRSRIKDPK